MAKMDMINLTEHGNPMPRYSKSQLKLLTRVVDRVEFTKAYIDRLSHREIAEKFDILIGQVAPLVHYWEMPERVKPQTFKHKAIDIDYLAERIWLDISPKVEAMLEAKFTEKFGPEKSGIEC